MNIAILSFYSGVNKRGVERWVADLSSRLSSKHNVTVFQNKDLAESYGYKIVSTNIAFDNGIRSTNWLAKHLFIDYQSIKVLHFILKIVKKIYNSDFDIVIPTDGGWESAIIRLITWIRRKTMIVVGHAGVGWDDLNNLWCFPDCFVALSTYANKWANKSNPFVKSVYIPDAVDTKLFNPIGKTINQNLKSPIALCVSALESGKRLDLVIKAAAKLSKLNVLVCGSGEMKDELNKLGNELLGKRFEIREYDFKEMPSVYRSCDILVSASLPNYSFEMVLLEALACGLPVVVNDDPIRREIVGDKGMFADVNNADSFANTISRALLIKKVKRSLIDPDKYSWEAVCDQFNKLFQKFTKHKRIN